MIYFDNSATTGVKPREVIVSVNKALTSLSANPGRSGHNKAIAAAEYNYTQEIMWLTSFLQTGQSR